MEIINLKLIDGQFERDKARTLLVSLLNYKINYHELQKFSDQVRFGKDKENSEKRIQELNKEKQELINWLNTLDKTSILDINCNIAMNVKQ